MTVLVGHIFREEGEFLPSAIIESQSHQIRVTLDKRINVFQLLEGPIINVTKVRIPSFFLTCEKEKEKKKEKKRKRKIDL